MTKNLNVSIIDEAYAALETDAKAVGLDIKVHAARILENHVIETGLLGDLAKQDILIGRNLIDRAVQQTDALLAKDGFRPSITYEVIQSLCNDAAWLNDYRELVRDDPYKTGNPRKQAINQNLGYFIKKATGAKSATGRDGKPANVKVQGSIIQSYTPLQLS